MLAGWCSGRVVGSSVPNSVTVNCREYNFEFESLRLLLQLPPLTFIITPTQHCTAPIIS